MGSVWMNVDEKGGSFRENGRLEQTKTGNSSLCEVEAQRCCASGVGSLGEYRPMGKIWNLYYCG